MTETATPIAYAEGIVTVCRHYIETPLMTVAGVGGADVKARIDAILANRIGLPLTLSKRLVLGSAAVLSLAVPLVTGAIEGAAFAAGQLPGPTAGGPPIDPQIRFEVVSIKPFDASSGAMRSNTTPGRYEFSGLPLRLLVGQGLRATQDRIIGWPDWIDTERYTVAAKMPEPPPPATAIFVMIENLLNDRFKLVTHRETRELPVYNLVLARSDGRFGPAFKESSAECRVALRESGEAARRGAPVTTTTPESRSLKGCVGVTLGGLGTVSMTGTTIGPLANLLTQSVDRPVIDRTGLASFYDLTLKWTPEAGTGPRPFGLPRGVLPGDAPGALPPPPADPDAPDIFTAVQEQLGLKLEAGRGPVEVVVIDRLEKPMLD